MQFFQIPPAMLDAKRTKCEFHMIFGYATCRRYLSKMSTKSTWQIYNLSKSIYRKVRYFHNRVNYEEFKLNVDRIEKRRQFLPWFSRVWWNQLKIRAKSVFILKSFGCNTAHKTKLCWILQNLHLCHQKMHIFYIFHRYEKVWIG